MGDCFPESLRIRNASRSAGGGTLGDLEARLPSTRSDVRDPACVDGSDSLLEVDIVDMHRRSVIGILGDAANPL